MKNKNNNNLTMWIYGKHATIAALKNINRKIHRLLILSSLKEEFINSINFSKVKPEFVEKNYFISIFGHNAVHQGYAALIEYSQQTSLQEIVLLQNNNPILILDELTDPQNIGAIVRSAAAFQARCVIVHQTNSPEISPTIFKAASGAIEITPIIRVTNISDTIRFLKKHDFWCVCLDQNADQYLQQIDLHGKFAIIVGSEGVGVRKLTKQTCDIIAKLPVNKSFSTLNAAQAATIALYELYIQNTKGRQ